MKITPRCDQPELEPTAFTRFLRELSSNQALRVSIAVAEMPSQETVMKVRFIRVANLFQIPIKRASNYYYRIKTKQRLKIHYKQAA